MDKLRAWLGAHHLRHLDLWAVLVTLLALALAVWHQFKRTPQSVSAWVLVGVYVAFLAVIFSREKSAHEHYALRLGFVVIGSAGLLVFALTAPPVEETTSMVSRDSETCLSPKRPGDEWPKLIQGNYPLRVEITSPNSGCLRDRPVLMEFALSDDLGGDTSLWVLNRPRDRDVFYPMGCIPRGSSVIVTDGQALMSNYVGPPEPDHRWWELLIIVADKGADQEFRSHVPRCGDFGGPVSMRRDELPRSAQVKDSVYAKWVGKPLPVER
jgi:hypothetical protein